jgi:hypothetical protein
MPRPSRRTPAEGVDGDVYGMPAAKAEMNEISVMAASFGKQRESRGTG